MKVVPISCTADLAVSASRYSTPRMMKQFFDKVREEDS